MSACETIREGIQDQLDGRASPEQARAIELHLTGCRECREVRDGLLRVREALRALPEVPLPDEALEAVLRRTVGRRFAPRGQARAWWLAAAAAAVLLVAALLVRRAVPDSPQPTRAEIARAEQDARLALGVAARALAGTKQTTVRRVLADEVSPVLRRIPIRWPKVAEPYPARSRT